MADTIVQPSNPAIPSTTPPRRSGKRAVLLIGGVLLVCLGVAAYAVRSEQQRFMDEVTVRVAPDTAPSDEAAAMATGTRVLAPGIAAPDAAFTGASPESVRGTTLRVHEVRGTATVVLFASSWDEASLGAVRTLDGAQERLRSVGVRILAVLNMEPEGGADAIASRANLTLPLYVDESGEAGEAFGIAVLPEYFLIGEDGMLRAHASGPLGEDALVAWAAVR